MMIAIPDVLTSQQVSDVRARLDAAGDAWVDGRVTAGHQGARVKHNRQIAESSAVARELGDVVLGALERNPLFISAALPHSVYPPMFNHYEGGMQFGGHVDGAVRLVPDRAPRCAPIFRRRCSCRVPKTTTAANCSSRTPMAGSRSSFPPGT